MKVFSFFAFGMYCTKAVVVCALYAAYSDGTEWHLDDRGIYLYNWRRIVVYDEDDDVDEVDTMKAAWKSQNEIQINV